jgi:hypothetical protein
MDVFGDKTMIIAFDKGAVDRGKKHPDHQPEQQQTKKARLPGLRFPSWLE